MLVAATLALTLTPLLPLRVGVSSSPRVAALSCKLSRTGGNKQQDLADLMARAKAEREGFTPPEPLKPSAKSSKPTPPKPKAPKAPAAPKPAATRDQMFAMMQNAQMQKVEQTAKQQLSRYGQEKPRPARASPVAEQAGRPDPSAMGASRPAPPTAEEYAKFGQLLGSGADARGPVRAVSDEVLTRGAALPLPARGLAELDGVPSGFGSLEALAGEQGVLVLLASVDTLLSERWRSTLSAFHGQADFAALGAQVAAVSRVPASAYRKLSRKAGVAYPLLSDPQSLWLGPLRCETGGMLAFVVEPRDARIIASFRGSEPLELLRRVTSKLREYADGGAEAGAADAVEVEEEAEGVSDAAALDEMAAMWADAEGDSLAAAEAACGLGAGEEATAATAEAEAAAAALQVHSKRPQQRLQPQPRVPNPES